MLGIRKGPEPAVLRRHRASSPDASYDSLPDKEALRTSLRDEQGGLCAYCMRRVRNLRDLESGEIDLTIEHWSAQSVDPSRSLHWPDLLGVCRGRATLQPGAPHPAHTCDKARGNQPLSVHPARDADTIEHQCRYLGDGTLLIDAHPADVHTLNLNADILKLGRREIVNLIQQRAQKADLTTLRADLQRWESRTADGELREYAGVARYLLRRAIEQQEKKSRRTRKARV